MNLKSMFSNQEPGIRERNHTFMRLTTLHQTNQILHLQASWRKIWRKILGLLLLDLEEEILITTDKVNQGTSLIEDQAEVLTEAQAEAQTEDLAEGPLPLDDNPRRDSDLATIASSAISLVIDSEIVEFIPMSNQEALNVPIVEESIYHNAKRSRELRLQDSLSLREGRIK
jgi:hypothetical protein